jgi:hypothetical protein
VPALLPSELPVRARTRRHWIVLFRLPSRLLTVALLVLLLLAIIVPNPMAWALAAIVAMIVFFRWHTWRAEQVILTGQRIIRVQGVPETTKTEASLRLDRISGGRMVQSVPGKILRYADIELEAPGEHPGVRRLKRIAHPHEFYLALRKEVFDEGQPQDPNDVSPDQITGPLPFVPNDHITAPLPVVPADRDRFGRRRSWESDDF